MNPKPVIFIVYVWRQPQGFKASAREVGREEALQFERPQALLRYLVGLLPESPNESLGGGEHGGK